MLYQIGVKYQRLDAQHHW